MSTMTEFGQCPECGGMRLLITTDYFRLEETYFCPDCGYAGDSQQEGAPTEN